MAGPLIIPRYATQQTQDIESMLVYRWSSVVAGGPALNQH